MKFELIPPFIKTGFRNLLNPVIRLCVKLRLNPNWLTTASFFISAVASYHFAAGALRTGAVLLLFGGIFDMIDGAVARAADRVTRFGALWDSTLDRYAEIMVFIGIGHYFISKVGAGVTEILNVTLLVFVGLAGSLMVSYIRARAEGLQFECKVGVMQRPERLVMISVGALISDQWLIYMIIAIAVFSNVPPFNV
jgi:CDP-diacylglycerol---glycerol-3-phosphate 3-phosphatidyltransferase